MTNPIQSSSTPRDPGLNPAMSNPAMADDPLADTAAMSKAHNPVQDIYLRKVVGRENKVVSVAHKALTDPARGCKM